MITHPPGLGPFHVKGLLYLGNIEYHNAEVPGGFEAVLARLRTPELKTFFEQPFTAAAMYDAAPVLALSEAASHVKGRPHLHFVRETARWNAERRLRSVYRSLLGDSIDALPHKLPRLTMQYFDFGRVSVEPGRGRFRLCFGQIPRFLLNWYVGATQGYGQGALELLGAKGIRLSHPNNVRTDGEAEGIETVAFSYDCQWITPKG